MDFCYLKYITRIGDKDAVRQFYCKHIEEGDLSHIAPCPNKLEYLQRYARYNNTPPYAPPNVSALRNLVAADPMLINHLADPLLRRSVLYALRISHQNIYLNIFAGGYISVPGPDKTQIPVYAYIDGVFDLCLEIERLYPPRDSLLYMAMVKLKGSRYEAILRECRRVDLNYFSIRAFYSAAHTRHCKNLLKCASTEQITRIVGKINPKRVNVLNARILTHYSSSISENAKEKLVQDLIFAHEFAVLKGILRVLNNSWGLGPMITKALNSTCDSVTRADVINTCGELKIEIECAQ
jgi:hypothetical protein